MVQPRTRWVVLLLHSLPKIHYRSFFCSAPIQWQPSVPYITVKRRKRPIADITTQSMFDGIEMDVVRATLQIRFVAHGVFVKTPLPNTAFVPPLFAGRQVFGTREMCGEFGFNQPPAQGIIRIIGRQCPNGVNMVRQYAYGDGFKGILFLHIHIGRTQ